MKIICNRESLASSFGLAMYAVKAQSPKPILRNVKLEAHDGEIVLFATDMEVGIRVTFPCDQVLEAGSVILSDRVLFMLKECREEMVTIESDATKTVITGDSRFVFATEDPEEFPGTPTFEENNFIVTKARYVKEAIKRTIFATDNESGRYALGGVQMDYKSNLLNFVATDGRRMAAQQIDAAVQGEYPEQKTAIATVRSLTLLDRLLLHGEADVCLALQENSFMVKSENVFFYSSLLEGRFPDWRVGLGQVRNPQTIELPIQLFSQAIRLAAIVTDKTCPGVILEFGDGKMTVSAANAERGEIEKSFAIDFQNEWTALKLNEEYVSAFLRTLSDESIVKMNFVDSRTGVLFETNDGYRYLVMPMQLEPRRKPQEEEAEGSESSESA